MENLDKIASKIIKKYWKDGDLPIQPSYIATQMGISVLSDPNLKICGYYTQNGISDKKYSMICYNPLMISERQFFTIAHELSHHILNHGECSDTKENFSISIENNIEKEANQLALRILIPEDYFRALIEVRMERNIRILTKYFNVSKNAIIYRTNELGYSIE